MSIEQEIRNEIDNVRQLKIDVGDINSHLSVLERLCRDRNQKAVDDAYVHGLDDAWEAAKKIVLCRDDGGTSPEELIEIFGSFTIQQVVRKYTASEAIAKLKAYIEKQKTDDEIKVGDEVKLCAHKENYIVTSYEQNNHMCILMSVRGGFFRAEECDIHKTGRHFGIEKILKEMKAE